MYCRSIPARRVLRMMAGLLCFTAYSAISIQAQTAKTPDLSGTWSPGGGGGARGGGASQVVLKPEYVKAYEAIRAAEAAANSRGEPLANSSSLCLPSGMPSMMAVAVYPMEVIQTPKQITIVAEAFTQVRRIFLDRPQEKIEDVAPGYFGRSVGKWEGDTLVVDTIGIKTSVQYQRVPHSDKMRITERLRLTGPDALQDQITIEDPVTLEKPITYTLNYRRLPNYEMVEFVCDNNREFVDDKGAVQLKTRDK